MKIRNKQDLETKQKVFEKLGQVEETLQKTKDDIKESKNSLKDLVKNRPAITTPTPLAPITPLTSDCVKLSLVSEKETSAAQIEKLTNLLHILVQEKAKDKELSTAKDKELPDDKRIVSTPKL
jgi:hypothetical protein